ncbi:MAG: ATP-binding protein [Candidatus Helarchaeota archaeon]
MPIIIVDLDKCIGCGKCSDICIKAVFETIKLEKYNYMTKYFAAHPENCLFCCLCVGSCPELAITLKKKTFNEIKSF